MRIKEFEQISGQGSKIENEERPVIKYCSKALPNPNFNTVEKKRRTNENEPYYQNQKFIVNNENLENLQINRPKPSTENYLKSENVSKKKEQDHNIKIVKSRNKSHDAGYFSCYNSTCTKNDQKESYIKEDSHNFKSKSKEKDIEKCEWEVQGSADENENVNSNKNRNEKFNKLGNRKDLYFREIKADIKIDDNYILLEGYINKITKKANHNLIRRYCKISKSYFMYYKDQYNAELWLSRPISAIAVSEMESVQVIKYEEKPQQVKQAIQSEFYFEIKTKLKDFLNYHYTENYEVLNDNRMRKNLNEKIIMNNEKHGQKSLLKHERKSTHRDYLNQNIHLLRENINNDMKYKGIRLNECKNSNSKQYLFENVCFDHLDDAIRFHDYYLKNKSRLCNPVKKEETKGYKFQNTYFQKQNWTYKEIDWYISSNCFLFSVKTQKELSSYVCLLNWLIENYI